MSDLVKNIIRFVVFILVQVYILHKVPPLHRFIVPYLYYLFILWLPFNTNRTWLMVIAFIFGLTLDYFLVTPGLHAAACVLIAYIRPFMVNLLIRQEGAEQSYGSPSIHSMGFAPYSIFVVVLTFLHHGYLVFLEWLQFGNFWYFLGKVGATTAVSLLLILITELLFYRKERYRTNAA
ncbi:rod shape-determining protein MreD [Flavihumibacter profundi]|jgi:rod shape-determining protein MreD|uniref:rod shape-determining protein MreD n=1 Tax=Flavihumibacter profundi TaxID=2716883 RepID=UPI001CC41362|nr:rod shape-determining protein MreD [Flavihumibacter profundi]MBZ5858083.1 rod shape-determining protein MreD [Flavihumibacter profundi]